MEIRKEIVWGGKVLSISTGRVAKQSTGAVLVSYGDTVVLCTVVASNKAGENQSFFPLTVNYIEKAYSVGKIPGGFNKREGKPSERETLISRLIDRPLRPLFHPDFKNETQIICTVLSFDKECNSDIVSIIGASAALAVSGLPFVDVVGAVRVGLRNGEFYIKTSSHASDELTDELDLVMAGTKSGVLMVESEAKELSEEQMLKALQFGHDAIQPVIELIKDLVSDSNVEYWTVEETNPNNEISEYFNRSDIKEKIIAAYSLKEKKKRYAALDCILDEVIEFFKEQKSELSDSLIADVFHDVCSEYVRAKILNDGIRIDGRKNNEIRPITCDLDVLPKAHGSSIFCRGETQVLGICTLGTITDEQVVDGLCGEYSEKFSLHYNFPPFSVGEIGRLGAPGRREIGHGKLAWRAIHPILPDNTDFPYTIRSVTEVLSCNGSSSMGTVCATSMALMTAGVPIKKAVAGIAMGLIHTDDRDVILSDIMGDEDHLGDMDFKVAGTKDGITALQMDIKISGISFEILEKALKQAKDGKAYILNEIAKAISEARPELNKNAPRIKIIYIDKNKIRDVIGPGGKIIKDIIEETGAKIDIEDSGKVVVASPCLESLNLALQKINYIAGEPEVGEIYTGKVVKITDFGAFVNFFGRDGLIHVSEFDDKRVERVSDYVKEGQTIEFMFMGIERGKYKLSLKALRKKKNK